MTSQEVKRWLLRYRNLEPEISSLLREQEHFKALLLRVTPAYSMSAHGSTDPHSKDNIYSRIVELSEQIDEAIDSSLDARAEILAEIERVQDEKCRAVLRLRYIDGRKWDEIAETLGYDVDGKKVYWLHGKALKIVKLHIDTK